MQLKNSRRRAKLSALMGAALAIPGLGLEAQNIAPAPIIRFKYGEYRDRQSANRTGDDRMRVHAPMMQFRTPLGESTDFEGTLMYESMSGASPLYLSSLSGASGLGIHDGRRTGDFKFTKYLDQFSFGIGGSISNEDDYDSKGIVSDFRYWTEDKNTVFAFGVGLDSDDITSSNDRLLQEERTTANYLIGITQNLDSLSAMQMNLTYSSADGYLSDPYKTFDNRPRSRESLAWLTRYVRYIEELDSSVHLDYRFFRDTFDIVAHTFEAAYYQPLGRGWMIRPSIRYYFQGKADFFRNGRFPSEQPEGFFSADQRLSRFGEWGGGIKLIKELSETLSVDLSVQTFHQRSGFHPGSKGSQNIEPFTGYFAIFGITKKF